jgi:hypothetical protein
MPIPTQEYTEKANVHVPEIVIDKDVYHDGKIVFENLYLSIYNIHEQYSHLSSREKSYM